MFEILTVLYLNEQIVRGGIVLKLKLDSACIFLQMNVIKFIIYPLQTTT